MHQENENDKIDKELIVEKYTPLVHKIVNRLNYGFVDKDDLVQAGFMGLLKAIENFNSNLGNFISFASIYIMSEVKEELRNNKLIILNKEIISIIRKLPDYENKSLEEMSQILNTTKEKVSLAFLYKDRISLLNDDNNEIDRIESSYKENEIISCISKLNDVEKMIIYNKYLYNMSQSEIAESLDVSQSSVSRLEKKALKRLKSFIE